MSIVKMKRASVIGLDDCKEDLIRELMDYGMLEITDQSEKLREELWARETVRDEIPEIAWDYERAVNRAEEALEVVDKYGGLKSPLFSARRHVSHEGLKAIWDNSEKTERLIDDMLELNAGIQKTREELNRLEQERSMLIPWGSLDIPLELEGTGETRVIKGIFPLETWMDEVEKALERGSRDGGEEAQPCAAVIKQVDTDKNNRYTAVISYKQDKDRVESILRSFGFSAVDFGDLKGLAGDLLRTADEAILDAQIREDSLKAEVRDLARQKNDIEDYCDLMNIRLDRERVRTNLLRTKNTFFIEGWIPERAETEARTIFEANRCYYEFSDPGEEDEVPVLLSNSGFFAPTEAITEMYSLPSYRGFDPTSIYSLFYIIFFGIMFSDAGYGLIMFIGCFLINRLFELEGTTGRMIKLFMYCGISTAIFGVLFGGFFGDLIGVFSGTFLNGEASFDPLWFNPLDDPITFLAFSLVLGVIHLFVGMGIQAYMQIRDGHWFDAVCDEGFWYFTIVGLGIWLFGGNIGIDTRVGMYLAIFGAAGLLLTGGRHKKGFGKITGGLSNLYNITSWLSDILSYARLLALGLATGVIAQVINTMGAIFGGGILGLILFILIFIVGHLVNFAINALGAFIHSARLQYVEFFGKFYIDGGEPFKPYSFRTKYIKITEE